MDSNFPNNLYGYYQSNTSSFEERTDKKKKILYYTLLIICIIVMIMPSLIPFSSLTVRIAAGLGIVIFGFAAFIGGADYYSKVSGGKINDILTKKFDSSTNSEEELLSMFENNDIVGLINANESDNQPLQLYVHEDEMGRVFYLQLMKYYSQSDFRGMSEVKIISEPEYSTVYKNIKG